MMFERIERKLQDLPGLSNLERLPGGGQSYAFSAFDRLLNRKIFLKIYWYSEKYNDSLLLEPRKLSALYNRNEQSRIHIVGLYSAETINIESEEFIVLRMEYCEGSDLASSIQRYGLSFAEAQSIGKELCEGIHYLHSSDIAHRDIKPANIMISGCKAKIIDLGSVIEVEQDSWRTVSSGKTQYYSPPETLAATKSYSKRSDIFQIGAVLWEMFYGSFDFHRIDKGIIERVRKKLGFNDAMEAHEISAFEDGITYDLLKKDIFFETVTEERKHIPKCIIKLLKQCTSFDPKKRFESSASVRNAISRLVVPNWKMCSEELYTVTGWRGKDFRISLERKGGETRCYFESSISGANNYRRTKAITTFEGAIEEINGR